MHRPSQGVQLSLLDFYQMTKATTEEDFITNIIPDNIRTKLADIYGNILYIKYLQHV